MFENRLKLPYPNLVIANSSTSISSSFLFISETTNQDISRSFEDTAITFCLAPAPILTYNLAYFLRTLALSEEVEHQSLTTLREKLLKIGAGIVPHGRYVTFQLAGVAVPKMLFAEILRLIGQLRPRPVLT